MEVKSLNRNIFQRLMGACETKEPKDKSSWTYKNGNVELDLSKTPELNNGFGAVRLEGKNLPQRLLVIRGEDEFFYAFKNHCTHGDRRLDYVPGTETIQCCSVGKSTFDFGGMKLYGSAKADIKTYAVSQKENILTIKLA
jgi:nitrite reductase/ring-hydroxylating ferredoxin subunit